MVLAWLLGKPLFSGLAEKIDTKRGIILALAVFTAVIAVWGFFLEFGDRVLVPGLDGGDRPGRQPGAQPQPVCQHVAGRQER